MNTTYYTLESLAIKLNLPQGYLRQMAEGKKIPFLVVGGRKRFNPAQVQAALDKLAERGTDGN
jgi:excisionase family DNA binding protein